MIDSQNNNQSIIYPGRQVQIHKEPIQIYGYKDDTAMHFVMNILHDNGCRQIHKYSMKYAYAFCCDLSFGYVFNTLRPRQNGRHFPDDIFKWIFLNENVWILINISLKFVPRGPINNIPTLVQVMAWRRPGDKPLSEPMMFRLPTYIYASLGLNELTQATTLG